MAFGVSVTYFKEKLRVYKLKDIAEILGVSVRTIYRYIEDIYRYIEDGKLKANKPGGQRLVSQAAPDDFLGNGEDVYTLQPKKFLNRNSSGINEKENTGLYTTYLTRYWHSFVRHIKYF